MKKLILIIALLISGYAYAGDMYKVQGVIRLDTKAEAIKSYLDKESKLAGINAGKANAEASVVDRDIWSYVVKNLITKEEDTVYVRDGKTLSINLFFDNLADARKAYDYLVKQAGDMQDIGSKDIGSKEVSKSTIKLLKTTNHKSMSVRRVGDKIIASFTK